jgi:LEA14-like dessication related protein
VVNSEEADMTGKILPLPLLITLLLGCMLSGCAVIRPEPPEVQLAGLTISDISLSHANFLATLNLYNPNSTALDVEGLEFALFLDEVQVARGITAKSFSIPAEQTGSASLRLAASFLNLFRLSQRLKVLDAVPFRIAGEVKIGGPGFLWMTVPIDSQGTIPLAGTLDQLLFAPDQFWRQPGHQPPDNGASTAPAR